MKNFVIYRSSAGSGKTYTLVKEYIRLALSSENSYKHILAVTFTNKAAEEMKTRIISRLIALSKGEDKKLEEQLIADGVKGDISFKAAKVLESILHKYSYFSVSTIDSFFHRIIRSFAKELSLPLGFNIELDNIMVMDKITEELLEEIGEREELTKYLEDYVFYSMDENKGWKIDRKIKELAREIFNERYWIKKGDDERLADNIEKMQGFISTMFLLISDFEKKMLENSLAAQKMLDEHSLAIEDFPYGKSGFMNFLVNKIAKKDYEPGKRVQDAYEDVNKWSNKKSKPEVKKAAEGGMHNLLKDTVELYNKEIKQYNSARELIKTIYVLGIYRDLMNKLKGYRDENKMMLISDTNNILMKVISGDSSPFIYEKTGTTYKNYLIDEFQDTSTYQWKNFLPLIENSLAESNFSMIVGDVKQSIYRWRNGNMKLLLSDVKKDLFNLSDEIDEKYLNENFRSRREVIEFNNRFFTFGAAKLSSKLGGDDNYVSNSYSDIEQSHSNASKGGYVNITFLPKQDEGPSAKVIALGKTVEAVKLALTEGFMQKDIMILTRNKADGGETAHYLTDAGFKVVSNDSLLLTNSPKVKLILNILKYIVDGNNSLAQTEILYNYLVYIKNENPELDRVFNDYKVEGCPLFKASMPAGFFTDAGKLNPELFRLSLYELTEMLIRIFSLNENADAYLMRFMEAVTEFALDNSSDVPGFIEWWDEHSEEYSIIIPEQEDAIRVMTIHKAKGLQSPIVIMPCANWGMEISGTRDLIWVSSDYPPFNESSAFLVKATKTLENSHFEKDYNEEAALTMLDNLNLLYVAFTRAIERLYVFIPEGGSRAYNTGKFIKETISSSEELSTGLKNENEFETGSRAHHVIKDVPGDNSYKPEDIVSENYLSKIVIQSSANGLTIEKRKKLEESRNRGRIIHETLALIKYPDEAEKALETMKIKGHITAENEEEVMLELLEIFKMDEVKKWFSKEYEIKTEAEILMPDKSLYKPDRVLLKDKKAVVIDYKTGKHSKEHINQVKQYGDVLNKMGYTETEKYLFYITEKKIVKVQ